MQVWSKRGSVLQSEELTLLNMENVLHSPEYDIKSIVSCAFLVNPFRVSARFETQQLYFVC